MQYVRAIAQYYLIWLNLKIDGVIAIKSFVHRPVKLLYMYKDIYTIFYLYSILLLV
jgi:hypothetical protein